MRATENSVGQGAVDLPPAFNPAAKGDGIKSVSFPGGKARKYNPDLENIEIQLLMQGVSQQYSVNFADYASVPLRRRIWDTLRKEKVRTISGLQEKLLHDPEAMKRFLLALAPDSSPYGPDFYSSFRNNVVPMLKTYPFIRIWHAGSGAVAEIYAMAIILMEEGVYDKSMIYATDTSDVVLQRVQDGVFPVAAASEYKSQYLQSGGKGIFDHYYSGGGNNAIFDSALKKNMVFAQHNLETDGSFNEFNLIICRDVLSGFNEPLQARAHQLLYESLGLFGLLGLGPRESIESSPYRERYEVLDLEHRLYRKLY